ncbi:Saccharopine dehydrogenase, partial [Prunus dulcis]
TQSATSSPTIKTDRIGQSEGGFGSCDKSRERIMAGASSVYMHLKSRVSLCNVTAAVTSSPSSSSAEAQIGNRVQLPEKTRNSRVLVLGGTGRVGGSTAIALSKLCPDLQILVGGRNREKGANMVATLGGNSEFSEVNIDNVKSLEAALKDVDLVVHAAGPFQQAEKCTVLEAALQTKTAYVDVCDDTAYSLRAKSFNSRALAANVPAITTGGIYPGVSNVMAAELVRAARSESKGKPERLRFYYYTAGTGGAGPTILATSFLLLGEEELLRDRSKVQQMVDLFDPVVRRVDSIAGERVSMRVDLECSDGRNTVGIFSHKRLSVSVEMQQLHLFWQFLREAQSLGFGFQRRHCNRGKRTPSQTCCTRNIQFCNEQAIMDGGNKSKRVRVGNIRVANR